MDYVFKIGPVKTAQGPQLFFFLDHDGVSVSTYMAESDLEGLRQIAKEHPGKTLYCGPELMAAGADRLGFQEAAPGASHRESRALIALEMAQREQVRVIEHEKLWIRLCEACARFLRAQPWTVGSARRPLWIEFSGDKLGEYEGLVTGGEGLDGGLALYPERGALRRVERLAQAGRQAEAARTASLGLVLTSEPAFVVETLADLCGLSRMPVPTRVHDGQRIPLSDEDLLGLLTAVEAVIRLAAGERQTRLRVEVEDLAAEAEVRPLDAE